eukprot:3534270-Rhodomonas_salina.1
MDPRVHKGVTVRAADEGVGTIRVLLPFAYNITVRAGHIVVECTDSTVTDCGVRAGPAGLRSIPGSEVEEVSTHTALLGDGSTGCGVGVAGAQHAFA